MKSQAPPHQTLNFALRSKNIWGVFLCGVCRASPKAAVKSKIFVYQRQSIWKFVMERV